MMKETATQKKQRILKSCKDTIFMYDFRGKFINSFSQQTEAAEYLGKSEASISNYIKKENRFDGIHFLCRSKV